MNDELGFYENGPLATGAIDPFDKTTWTDDSRTYFENVDEMLMSKSRELLVFSNDRPWHAVYLIAKFFEIATSQIRIFSGSLTRKLDDFHLEVYGNPRVIEAARCFLQKPNAQLSVVVQNDIDVDEGQEAENHPLVSAALALEPKGGIRVRKASQASLNMLEQHRMLRHMMIVDKFAWRMEQDSTTLLSVKADVGIGDRSFTKKLCRLFDEVLFEKGINLLQAPVV